MYTMLQWISTHPWVALMVGFIMLVAFASLMVAAVRMFQSLTGRRGVSSESGRNLPPKDDKNDGDGG
jgi:hypothetical protein